MKRAHDEGVTVPGVEPVSARAPRLRGRVMMNQDWRDLTFLHWAVEPAGLHLMPPGVRPDTLDGATYVGLIPFRMVDAGIGRGPGVPWAGSFLETNVRLYSVDETGRRGIVFLSLDTDRASWWPALARRSGCRTGGRGCGTSRTVTSARTRRPGWPGLRARSKVVVRLGAPRSAHGARRVPQRPLGSARARVDPDADVPNEHEPWPVHDAEVLELDDGLRGSVGLGELAGRAPDHVAFSPGVHTEFAFPGDASRPRSA